MKRALAVCLMCAMGILLPGDTTAYRLLYKEQLYRQYHRHLYNYVPRIKENIYYLEQIQQADFANPLHALVPIEEEAHWERYRQLFNMHISLLLVEQYMQWSSRYTKYTVYFYNYPWQRQNIESLGHARDILEAARYYWREARQFSAAAWESRGARGAGESHWINQNYRIENGLLDYESIIARHQRRIEENIQAFEAMDETTY